MTQSRDMFSYGMQVFIEQVCDRNRDRYTAIMCHGEKDGYVEAIRAFYRTTGRLKVADRDNLLHNGVVPQFAITVYRDLELRYFGIDLISHRHAGESCDTSTTSTEATT